MLHSPFTKLSKTPVFYKKIRTSNTYEKTSLSSGSSKSLSEQTKAQVLNNQEPKALLTQKAQEAHIVTDLKVSKALNKENTDSVKNDDALFTSANNMYTKHQTFELEDFNNVDANKVNEQILADTNLDSHINIDQPQIKTKTAKKEPTEDTPKELTNFLIENYFIDTNIIVDPLITLYNNSKVDKSSLISNDNNEFQLL
ncbi:24031_t:CDS:2 [Cetraspora pellucida]|uniref:24031_t:CDS:1 n=1 Tax=Cetraspora pellucida TaxID=1433469 RepID=A0A9N9B3Q5_9GLOM|nr:24031_t:CDS:2 [Cetraspora pellucida]